MSGILVTKMDTRIKGHNYLLGELWSPLVELVAFFEEVGGVIGLLSAISDAASWDEQMSEGKALSEREEAVLRALEMLTRLSEDEVWLKAAVVREGIAKLLGQSVEQLGHAQWIAHIMTPLQLLDSSARRRQMDGMVYRVTRSEVIDMMRRYEVTTIQVGEGQEPLQTLHSVHAGVYTEIGLVTEDLFLSCQSARDILLETAALEMLHLSGREAINTFIYLYYRYLTTSPIRITSSKQGG